MTVNTLRKKSNTSLQRLAAIDIGTNSFHLIVVEIDHHVGKFRILYRERDMVRLGEGGLKRLSATAMERGVRILKKFRTIADSEKAPIRAIATSAVREASNRYEFINRVKKETGIRTEVVSGEEEARLIYLGVLSCLPVFDKKILLIDIGGGSTELLIGDRRMIFYSASLKLGAVRLTRRFFKQERLTADSIRKCREHIAKLLSHVCSEIRDDEYEVVVGTSGTILNLARMIRYRQEGSKPSKDDNLAFSKEELFEIVDDITAAKDPKRRAEIGGLDAGRVDIITAGSLILKEVFKKLKIKKMTVSKSALREGVILDTVEKGLLSRNSKLLRKAER